MSWVQGLLRFLNPGVVLAISSLGLHSLLMKECAFRKVLTSPHTTPFSTGILSNIYNAH